MVALQLRQVEQAQEKRREKERARVIPVVVPPGGQERQRYRASSAPPVHPAPKVHYAPPVSPSLKACLAALLQSQAPSAGGHGLFRHYHLQRAIVASSPEREEEIEAIFASPFAVPVFVAMDSGSLAHWSQSQRLPRDALRPYSIGSSLRVADSMMVLGSGRVAVAVLTTATGKTQVERHPDLSDRAGWAGEWAMAFLAARVNSTGQLQPAEGQQGIENGLAVSDQRGEIFYHLKDPEQSLKLLFLAEYTAN